MYFDNNINYWPSWFIRLALKHKVSKVRTAQYWLLLSIRSGAVEEHVEAVGDVLVAVGERVRAAGWGNHSGLTVFGGEPWGAIHSFTGLQQTAPGAQDTALTPARYRIKL